MWELCIKSVCVCAVGERVLGLKGGGDLGGAQGGPEGVVWRYIAACPTLCKTYCNKGAVPE